jgi:alkylhydroperoxidase family enzyme
MAFIRQFDPPQATGLLQRVYQSAIDRAGGVANIIRVMSLDAPVCQTSMLLYASLMKQENALKPAVRELLATVVSNANDCYY